MPFLNLFIWPHYTADNKKHTYKKTFEKFYYPHQLAKFMKIVLKPEEVRRKFGRMFSNSILTLVDEKNAVLELIEDCTAKGPVEWDLINRLRAGGAAYAGWIEGKTLFLRAKIGKFDVNFGPADFQQGGQALESVEVTEKEVITSWIGIAGAGLGLAACLSQAPGVLEAEYPSKDDLEKVGGGFQNRVKIKTPKYKKLVLGIDNTDVKTKGATWASALKVALEVSERMGLKLISHRIFQCYPEVEWKTTNNVSSSVVFALPWNVSSEEVLKAFVEKIKPLCYSNDACLVAYEGIEVPKELKDFGLRVKKEVVDLEEALELAEKFKFKVIPITGKKGAIGALAALALYDEGIAYAAFDEDPALRRVKT